MRIHPIAECLGTRKFFADLDAAAVADLAACARNLHVRAGEYLVRAGGTAEHF